MRRSAHPTHAPCRPGERGVTMPIVAVSLVVLIVATAFTVDLGRLMNRGRDLQLVTDLAALDAARSLDFRPADEQRPLIEAAARTSARRNDFGPGAGRTLEVHLGALDDDGSFVGVANPATDVPTALQVVASDDVAFLFQSGSRSTTRRSVAHSTASARLVLGSGLIGGSASCDLAAWPAAAASNGLLGALLGSTLGLDVVSHQGLACSELTLGELTAAAGLGTDVGALLSAEASVGSVLDLAITALEAQGADSHTIAATAALQELQLVLGSAPALPPITLGDLVAVEGASAEQLAGTTLGVGSLLQGALLLGQEGTAIAIPALAVGVPGLGSVTVSLGVIEAPQFVVGPLGSTVRTAQVRVRVHADVVNLLGIAVQLPLVVEAAGGEATLLAVECADGTPTGATVRVATSGARLMIGTMPDGQLGGSPGGIPTAAPLFTLPGLPAVTGAGSVDIAGSSTVRQVTQDELGRFVRVAGGSDVSSSGSLAIAGLPLIPVVQAVLAPALDTALATIVAPLLDALGAHLAYADVAVLDPTCPSPRLLA